MHSFRIFFRSYRNGIHLGKIKNIDIRDFGSGNSGTTNTMRVLGKKAGLITFFVDALKAVFCWFACLCFVS